MFFDFPTLSFGFCVGFGVGVLSDAVSGAGSESAKGKREKKTDVLI